VCFQQRFRFGLQINTNLIEPHSTCFARSIARQAICRIFDCVALLLFPIRLRSLLLTKLLSQLLSYSCWAAAAAARSTGAGRGMGAGRRCQPCRIAVRTAR
jgi:hypothetical protein